MPNFSGKWGLTEQLQAVAQGTWTGIALNNLYAWGSNSSGQLGQNDRTNRSSPTQVGTDSDWAWISVGLYRASGVKTNGTLWSVGSNTGDGTVVSRSSPVQIGALTNWARVYSDRHSIARKTDGTLWSWGIANNGCLGDNSVVSKSSPVQIGGLTDWTRASAGDYLGFGIRANGTLWAWGRSFGGGLGNNTSDLGSNRSSPIQVGSLTNWASIAANRGKTPKAVKTDGTLWAWGINGASQVGDGTPTDRSSPVQIEAATNWALVASGQSESAAIKTNGTLWVWGLNGSGQLGLNTYMSIFNTPQQLGSLTTWASVAIGSNTAAVKTDGTLWAWGGNNNGQLGQNNLIFRSSPVQVGAKTGWVQAATGPSNTFAIAVDRTN